jgi:hypothetical protein
MLQQVHGRAGSRRPARWTVRVAALAMAAATGAGCAGPTAAHRDPGGDPGSADRVPVLLRSAGLRLPLEDFFPSVTENQRLARAGRALLRQCMREFGIDYAAPDPPSVLGPLTWTERRYGLTDPAQAGHGYWADTRAVVARAAAAGRPRDTATAAANDLATGEGAAVVNGRPVPPGGCAAEARRRLTAHDPAGADPTLAQRLLSDSFFGSQQDPRVHAALTQWSACMAAAGYRYAGPLDPPEDARFQQGLTPLEVATAAADIGCKQRTNLVGIWFTVEASRQWSQVGANSAALRLARAAFQAELAVAAAVGV